MQVPHSPLVLEHGLRLISVQLGAAEQFTLFIAALTTEMMFLTLSTLPVPDLTSNNRASRCSDSLILLTSTGCSVRVDAPKLSNTSSVQFNRPASSSAPAGSVELVKDSSDTLTTTRLDRLVTDWKPNWYVSGRSGSVHRAAENWNSVLNSSPSEGVTRNTPGRGAPFVVTDRELVEEPQVRVKTSVARCGSVPPATTRLNAVGRTEAGSTTEVGVVVT